MMYDVELTTTARKMYAELTALQKDVAMGKLAGLNNVQAYLRSKGRAKSYEAQRTGAAEILSHPLVAKFVREVEDSYYRQGIMTRDEMAIKLSAMADTTIEDLCTLETETQFFIDPESEELVEISGQTKWSLKPIDEMTGAGLAMISELKVGKDGYSLKTQSQLAAKKQLSELMGYNKPQRMEMTGADGGPIKVAEVSDVELETKLKALGLGRYHDQLGAKIVK